ncbi:unnamed protein product (macronuclear) [Paramecium tetraurelia]|uniref:Protein kinase domain-containing protein n=1 Tax=Paramecium tetraurelia TaxID=5888 RepID=A0C7B5_PARTE|nr:uncharacterized protein GSPATT00035812001 [Paramecium tetraurelia]CAK66682.1 unnamed protein product [Paramecium tetraurelia]|eukprot:XP_001434079.1 hypothetical protein (macronuclear) [Paramecium tetraurelia strain d4-2]
MNQESMSISSSGSDETRGYLNLANNIERNYSFDQRVVLKLVSENPDIFVIAQEVPYDISQKMNQTYLNENQPIIGAGSFGTVFICWHMISKYLCAVKVHQRCQTEEILQQVNEYKIQTLLNKKFPNSSLALSDRVYIIQECVNYFTTYAGMELASATLSEYVSNADIEYNEFLSIYHSILQQILEMHSLRIAHRDIKLSNIMYTDQKGWVIADFGCAIFYKKQKEKQLIQGTKQYLPPNLRGLLKNNFSQIECEQNLFDNDIYAFLLSMLQIYKKGLSILQLQQMLDNESLLTKLPFEFQIHGKSYNYIKLNVLIGLNKVPLQQQFQQQQSERLKRQYEDNRANPDYIIELIIKQQKILRFSDAEIWQRYQLNTYENVPSLAQLYKTKSMEKVNQILQKYDVLQQVEFRQVEDKQLLEINSNTKQWQYNLIQMYYIRLGNVQQLYNASLEIQKYSQDYQISYRLSEIDCLIELNQLEEARQIVTELTDEQYMVDDISYLRLELYRSYLDKSWLETVSEISKILDKAFQHQITLLLLRISYNFTWIFLQYNYTLDNNHIQSKEFLSLELEFQKRLFHFGISSANPKEIIKQLEERGADKYGIRQILINLIQTINYSLTSEDKIQVEEFFETTIEYYKQRNLFQDWEIYYHYSIYCLKQQKFQKALSLINKAMQSVDQENGLYLLQVLFQQLSCEIYLVQSTKYQSTIQHILKVVNKIQSSQCRIYMIKRVVKMLYLIFMKGQYTPQIYFIIQQYLQSETNTEILFILNKLEWETILTYRHPQSLINLLNCKMLSLCENTDKNDVDTLKCFQNIAFVLRQQVKVDQSVEIQTIAINQSSKLIQNMIIFEDLFDFNQTETLNIENEIARLALLNKQLQQKQKTKEALKMMSSYTFNNYKSFA